MKTSIVFGIAALLLGFFMHAAWTITVSLPTRIEGIALRESTADARLASESSAGHSPMNAADAQRLSEMEVIPPILNGETEHTLPAEFSVAGDDSATRASLAPPAPDPIDEAQKLANQLTSEKLTFTVGGKDLDESSKRTLVKSLNQIKKLPENVMLEIRGHTDAEGTPPLNLKVSLTRAETVRDFLVSAGIPAEKLRSVGYGSTHPIAPNNTDSGRNANRRIEFLIRKLQ